MKTKKITQLDLFSGIGGFHLGFEKAGYKVKSYFSEIDKHAVAVYKHKFKDAEYVGSVIDIDGNKLPRIDLITFGSPCQDFSLAGKRKGMGGDRSSLVLEAIRLIDECRPSVFIWENVKGTFSSNDGADFAAILQAFTNIGGYRLEWELLNTSRVLPQNRERIYLVGYSTKPGRNWRGVFPIGESAGENTKLQRQQANTCTLTTRYGADGNGSYVTERKLDAQEVVQPLQIGQSSKTFAHKSGTLIGKEGQYAFTLRSSNPNRVKVKSAAANQAVVQPVQIGHTTNERIAGWHENNNVIAAHRNDAKRSTVSEHVYHKTTGQCTTIQTAHAPKIVDSSYRIRRLTPIECERLQGFPDNHTEFGNYEGEVKKMSNTQRYKQCGNAVTVDIVSLVANAVKPLFK